MLAEIKSPRSPLPVLPSEGSCTPVQLTELCPGHCARLHAAELDGNELALLRALGLSQKCRLRVCKAGDPWIVQVRETRIGLAASVAEKILVIPEIDREEADREAGV
jgi:Fe2+ transport system protein FeoA